MVDVSEKTVAALQVALLQHFSKHKRDLPWRKTADAYAIWVSEVMLQQTRVDTVIPYYERFLALFPTVTALADAPESSVLAAWSGLGYYRRARFLHAGARAVRDLHDGALPRTALALGDLPGIGAYTAGAIASIAFQERSPIVDGNVERVLTRIAALEGDPRANPTKAKLWSLAARFADHPQPGDVNQSLMELGATLCTPTSPQCMLCPAAPHCVARKRGSQENFPEKKPKAAPREERWIALVARTKDGRALFSKGESGRWAQMLVPPMELESDGAIERLRARCGVKTSVMTASLTHTLTHAKMNFAVHTAVVAKVPEGLSAVRDDDLKSEAVPKVTLKLLAAAREAPAKPRPKR